MYGGVGAEQLKARLDVPALHLFDRVRSTQDVAHELAQAGAPAGTVVLAEAQESGRGRQGRAWRSAPGEGVWCTVIERPTDVIALEVLSLRVGLALAAELDAVAGERVRLKWPNDLYLAAGKLGGILTEARWSGAAMGWVAIGVGVNVLTPRDLPRAAALPRGADRAAVLESIVRGVREASARSGALGEDELNRYQERDILTGREIDAPESGLVRGIAASGALLVETPGGLRHIRSGTVETVEGSA